METQDNIPVPARIVGGARLYKSWLDQAAQEALLDDLRAIVKVAPLFSPLTPFGKPMSVRLTSAGKYGWYSDQRGYRYIKAHPSGTPWPPVPDRVLSIWLAVSGVLRQPDCCLVNFYGEGARMGLHQDRDEADFSYPIVSVSLGDEALFRIGGSTRKGPTQSFWLTSGDVLVLDGTARLAHHGVDRIRFGSSSLLSEGGRINLTLRVVDP
jgi:alkylated DNA repair protein (DNA oxidative demethylase)